ncbi:hypothetical protein NEUTE1DRAFT_110592 [Neurospora tetrasperma FGSC 2508]|uniref:Uncharacterized protein n=1 Tax=Neurospora tetrasperma (strain FGSC 2508 / ATCC MYA-4615 / P0657) TaxID=510951 RepID=F8MLX9_NEUT8|nr:uncharacterized protein NEUTE1DRAFT_110592 [Neurospora tetrasperma FGSC 2508]EGO58494.1 hypothetical protein NEUTE1DRAFT_110592 [Neurospora tetrasperma FGSC 2508]
MRLWAADEGKGEACESTNDTITLPLAGCETSYGYTLEAPMRGGYDYEHPSFDASNGWNKYVNSFPPGGLHVDPEPHYSFTLEWISDLHRWMEGEIPASHLPDVQDDDSDNDSIKVSFSQLISGLIRAWKKSHASRGYGLYIYWPGQTIVTVFTWEKKDMDICKLLWEVQRGKIPRVKIQRG